MKPAVEYFGSINNDEARVVVRRGDAVYDLDKRLDLRNHSPTGFGWGYCGSGPAQLSLALLADYLGRSTVGDIIAKAVYQHFKDFVIAAIPIDSDWTYNNWSLALTLQALWNREADWFSERLERDLDMHAFEVMCAMADAGEISYGPDEFDRRHLELLASLKETAKKLLKDHFSLE